MIKFATSMVICHFAFSSAAIAQNTTNPAATATQPSTATAAPTIASPAPVVATIQPQTATVVKAGTEIELRTRDALTSKKKKSKVGDRFELEVSKPLMIGNVTVIPEGSKAIGEVTMMKNKGMWGKRGRLSARVLGVRVGDRQIRLTGTFDDAGSAGTAGVVGAAVVIPVAGFFVTGTSAEIPAGTKVKAFLDEDVPYSVPTSPSGSPTGS